MTTTRSSSQDGFSTVAIVICVVVLTAAGLAYLVLSRTSGSTGNTPMDFPPIEVDRDRLEQERSEAYAGALESVSETKAEALRTTMSKLNRLQFGEGENGTEESELAEKLSVQANAVIPQSGYDRFVAVGRPLFERCSNGLDKLLTALRNGDISLDRARTNPPQDRFADYREACGSFLPTLVRRQLVTPDGEWRSPEPLHRTIVEILQRLRWATVLHSGNQRFDQLTDYEVRLLMRWRIETEAYSLKQRRNYLDLVRKSPDLIPTYELPLARARLAYAGGRPDRAREILEGALEETDDRPVVYERAIRWLESRPEES